MSVPTHRSSLEMLTAVVASPSLQVGFLLFRLLNLAGSR